MTKSTFWKIVFPIIIAVVVVVGATVACLFLFGVVGGKEDNLDAPKNRKLSNSEINELYEILEIVDEQGELEGFSIVGLKQYPEKDVTLPNTYKVDGKDIPFIAVAPSVFANSQTLEDLTIPSNYKTIGASAFANCQALTSVFVEENSALETIAAYAFSGCLALHSFTFDQNSVLESIGAYAFSSAGFLNINTFKFEIDLGFNVSLKRIDEGAFQGAMLTQFTVPSSVTYIGDLAFSGCMYLERFNFERSENWHELQIVNNNKDSAHLFNSANTFYSKGSFYLLNTKAENVATALNVLKNGMAVNFVRNYKMYVDKNANVDNIDYGFEAIITSLPVD